MDACRTTRIHALFFILLYQKLPNTSIFMSLAYIIRRKAYLIAYVADKTIRVGTSFFKHTIGFYKTFPFSA